MEASTTELIHQCFVVDGGDLI